MKLEDQVTSLELSKKLKELGVKQESLFHWVKNGAVWYLYDTPNFSENSYHRNEVEERLGTSDDFVSAFTVTELGEMLQLDKVSDGKIIVERGAASKDWYVSIESDGGGVMFVSDTEADARAKMLIYLLENKLI